MFSEVFLQEESKEMSNFGLGFCREEEEVHDGQSGKRGCRLSEQEAEGCLQQSTGSRRWCRLVMLLRATL